MQKSKPLKTLSGSKIWVQCWVQNLRCQNSLCQNDAIFAMKYLLFAIYLFLIEIWILLHNKMGVNFERFGLFSTNASVFNLFNFDSQTKIIKKHKIWSMVWKKSLLLHQSQTKVWIKKDYTLLKHLQFRSVQSFFNQYLLLCIT